MGFISSEKKTLHILYLNKSLCYTYFTYINNFKSWEKLLLTSFKSDKKNHTNAYCIELLA